MDSTSDHLRVLDISENGGGKRWWKTVERFFGKTKMGFEICEIKSAEQRFRKLATKIHKFRISIFEFIQSFKGKHLFLFEPHPQMTPAKLRLLTLFVGVNSGFDIDANEKKQL